MYFITKWFQRSNKSNVSYFMETEIGKLPLSSRTFKAFIVLSNRESITEGK